MPNWCSNSFQCFGPSIELATIEALITGSDLGLMALDPNHAEHPTDNEAATERWGTKWPVEVHDVDLLVDGANSSLSFVGNSAWSPPTGLLVHASEAFPEVAFTMASDELGVGFAAGYAARRGVLCEADVEIPDLEDDEDEDAWYDMHAELVDRTSAAATQALEDVNNTLDTDTEGL